MFSKEDFAVGAKGLRKEVAGVYDKLHNYQVTTVDSVLIIG